MWPGLIVAGVGAGLWIAAIVLRDYMRQRRLMPERHGYSEAEFVRHFEVAGIPASVSQAVYREMRRYMLPRDVPVLPADDLDAVYRIDNEELNELVEGLAKTVGRDFRRPQQPDSGDPIDTVEDLVRYLNSLPVEGRGATG
jgi:hypothetical protein